MKKIISLFTIILVSFLFLTSAAKAQEKIQIVYFYVDGCSQCEKASPLLDNLESNYSDSLQIIKIDAEDQQRGNKLFFKFTSEYNLSGNTHVPIVYISDISLEGFSKIENELETNINKCSERKCELLVDPNMSVEDLESGENVECGTDGKPCVSNSVNQQEQQLNVFVVILAAFGDSINPCAIGVLAILIAFLLKSNIKQKRVLLITSTYIFSVFITYFLAGLGLKEIFSRLNLGDWINYLIAFTVIILGILSFYDAFNTANKPILAIPERSKPLIQKYISQSSIPASIIAGFLVSGFELPCTGAIYLSITTLIGTQTSGITGVMYLLLYNVIFVLPLIIISFLIIRGKNIATVKKFQKDNKRWIKIIMGIVMLFLAVLILVM